MTAERIDITTVASEPAETFESWKEAQDHDYHRTESALVDYVNSHIDLTELDSRIAESESATVTEFAALFELLGVDESSDAAESVEETITTYVSKQSA